MDWLCGLTLGGYQLADSRDVPERHQPWYWALSYWENCLTGLGELGQVGPSMGEVSLIFVLVKLRQCIFLGKKTQVQFI